MPHEGHVLPADAVNAYAGPVVEQAVNQIALLPAGLLGDLGQIGFANGAPNQR